MNTQPGHPHYAAIVGFLALLLLPTEGCRSIHEPFYSIPYDASKLEDAWIGFNENDATRYTLILTSGGQGMLYCHLEDGGLTRTKILDWKITGIFANCELEHDQTPSKPASLLCEVRESVLVGSFSGRVSQKEAIYFRRLELIERSALEARVLKTNLLTGGVSQ
jgi:hypothetical protein